MNKKQLELFYENILTLAGAIQLVGGNCSDVLHLQQQFIETLSRNGIELKVLLHPNIEG